jgi:hypothetical protein
MSVRAFVVPSEHIATISIEKGRDSVIRDAVHVHGSILQLLHHRAELFQVLLGWVLKIDRYVRVGHTKTANAASLIRESLLVRVEREIHDVADTERVNVGELLLGRPTRRGDPVVESTLVVDAVWVFQSLGPVC